MGKSVEFTAMHPKIAATMPAFTTESATEAANKSVLTRAERKRVAAELPQGLDFYTLKRLARTRKQIDSLSDMLEHEKDPAKIDRLASAIDRLAKHEHYLAGRPGPGNRKPAPERPGRQTRRDLGAVEASQSAPQLPQVGYHPESPDAPNG